MRRNAPGLLHSFGDGTGYHSSGGKGYGFGESGDVVGDGEVHHEDGAGYGQSDGEGFGFGYGSTTAYFVPYNNSITAAVLAANLFKENDHE